MLQLHDVSKSYTTADFTQTALDTVSISFRDNEFVAILGPSGSGKTTILNIIGGLDHYDSGDLVVDGISTKEYKDRDWDTYRNNRIGFVFQSYNLIPHQTVLANVELALTLSGVSRKERKKRAREALEKVGLRDHVNKKPSQLSGGQMQRVAVARALINDPEILLADEPTGALDSVTSAQIMDLLTDIAKDRLVIMVTHNAELAEEYATRTVNLRDGHVVDDSLPYEPTEEDKEKVSGKQIRRTKMSYFTALALSFNNLMTKKGRTLMTAFAGSIGIIGIAAILALANGVNNYIKTVEEDTLTVYPLSIESTGYDLTSMMVNMMGSSNDGSAAEDATTAASDESSEERSDVVTETKALSGMFSGINSNDLKSLKAFLESGESDIDDYINMISYDYGITPLVYSPDTENGVRQINPNTAFSKLSSSSLTGTAGEYAAMATSGSNTDVFSEMLNNSTLLESQYEVVAGKWPEKYDEVILALNPSGGISDVVLYTMGLRNPEELDKMIDEISKNEDIDVSLDKLELSYDEIMDVSFKLVNAADLYQKDTEYNVWKDKSDDVEYMKKAVENGTDLKIVGIVKPNPNASASSLRPGICYTADLQLYLIDKAKDTEIVKEQLANPELNVISGRTFQDEEDNPDNTEFDFSSLFTINGDAISSAFHINPDALAIDTSGMSNLNFDPSSVTSVPPLDLSTLLTGIDVDISQEDVNALLLQIISGFFASAEDDPTIWADPTRLEQAFNDYMNSPEVQAQIATALQDLAGSSSVGEQVQAALQTYMQTTMQTYLTAFGTSMQQQISSAMTTTLSSLSSNMAGAMSIDEEAFADAFQFNMDEAELQEVFMSFMTTTKSSYDNNLTTLGYADTDKPTSIDLYPIDFASKERVITILEDYNNRMEQEGEDAKVIVYTDIVGTLMSSVTDIVNMISYVLIAFVAISLVVSSIMIGIITYISVLERKKEIGILRSIGASKKDISHVFNAETVIVGFVAGLIGVGITALACIPANIIIYQTFEIADIASLPVNAAIILVGISIFLSFIAGLIPSSAASRKDPVEALRSE